MTDREKVIEALKERISSCSTVGDGFDVTINWRLADDILALLKEQEERINKMLHQPRNVICCYRCKWNSGTQDKPYCQKYSITRLPEWFCADGKKR